MSSAPRRTSLPKGLGILALASGITFSVLWRAGFLVHSIGGWDYVNEPLIRQLMRSSCFRRLEKIDQSGPAFLYRFVPPFTRASHSLGVWQILKRQQCNLAEQAAGLLHDTSHTAFSHLADYLFAESMQEAVTVGYQDTVHLRYLRRQNLNPLLAKYGLKLEDLDPDKGTYLTLEQPLPDICADRLEYNLHTALITHKMTKEEVRKVLKNAKFKDGKWFFLDKDSAEALGKLSLDFTQNFWASHTNISINKHFAVIVNRALEKGLLTKDELFTTDDIVLKRLEPLRSDPFLQPFWTYCPNLVINSNQNGPLSLPPKLPNIPYKTVHISPKFRGINPLVMTEAGLQRLTEISDSFRKSYEDVQQWCQRGYDLDIIDEDAWRKQCEQ